MAVAPVSASFQSLSLLSTSKLGPSGADSQVGGLVYVLGPSLANSLVRLGVSSTVSTPTGFFQSEV